MSVYKYWLEISRKTKDSKWVEVFIDQDSMEIFNMPVSMFNFEIDRMISIYRDPIPEIKTKNLVETVMVWNSSRYTHKIISNHIIEDMVDRIKGKPASVGHALHNALDGIQPGFLEEAA